MDVVILLVLTAFGLGFLACLELDRWSWSNKAFDEAYQMGYRHGKNSRSVYAEVVMCPDSCECRRVPLVANPGKEGG